MTLSTQRGRFEAEPQRLQRWPRPIPLVRLQTAATTIVTASDGDFLVQHLWVANVTGGAITYSIRLVPAAGSPSAANSIAEGVSLAANTSAVVAVGENLRLAPGSFLSALCGTNDAINIGGWGYDYFGDQVV